MVRGHDGPAVGELADVALAGVDHGLDGEGHALDEEPQVLHYGKPGQGVRLVEGMTFTIEPMINAGKRDIRQLADGWTIVTADHSLSAQWEHTVLVTPTGYEVLTVSAGTPPPPAFVAQAANA